MPYVVVTYVITMTLLLIQSATLIYTYRILRMMFQATGQTLTVYPQEAYAKEDLLIKLPFVCRASGQGMAEHGYLLSGRRMWNRHRNVAV
eukprot:scaffold235047_cov50-Prasinocladus_malaysianus.AAC.1